MWGMASSLSMPRTYRGMKSVKFNYINKQFGNYLFNLRPGVLIKTLSHIWGKLNLPTLLFKVGLLTLINMDSLIYLDKCQMSPF